MALASLDQYLVLLGLDGQDTTALNSGLVQDLTFADGVLRRWLKRPYIDGAPNAPITEYYDGNGRPELPLRHYPVQSVAGVWVDPQGFYGKGPGTPFSSTFQFVEGVDFVARYDQSDGTSKSGCLIRLGGGGASLGASMYDPWFWGWGRGSLTVQLPPCWLPGYGNVKVQYTPGYTAATLPAELAGACCELAAYFRRTKKLGGVDLQSEGLADYHYQIGVQQLDSAPPLASVRQALTRFRAFDV